MCEHAFPHASVMRILTEEDNASVASGEICSATQLLLPTKLPSSPRAAPFWGGNLFFTKFAFGEGTFFSLVPQDTTSPTPPPGVAPQGLNLGSVQPLPQIILGPLSDSTCLVKCLRGLVRVKVTAPNAPNRSQRGVAGWRSR